jgi:hypothetical protein
MVETVIFITLFFFLVFCIAGVMNEVSERIESRDDHRDYSDFVMKNDFLVHKKKEELEDD